MSQTQDRNMGLIHLFIALQVVGWVGVMIILVTGLVSRKIERHSTWYSFFASWILFCASYCLLSLAGQQSANPDHNLCAVQASLVYSAPPLIACTTFALVIQLWLNISFSLRKPQERQERNQVVNTLLLILPYYIHIAIFIGTLTVALREPASIHLAASGMYCNLLVKTPRTISGVVYIVIMTVSVLFEAFIGTALYRNWRALRSLPGRTGNFLSMTIRLSIFSTFVLVSIGVGLAFVSDVDEDPHIGRNIFIALSPVAATILFGTQKDMFDSWLFWRTRPAALEPQSKLDDM